MSEPDAIDRLAYRFWSVHPRELDEWFKTAPAMPEKYNGGVRAWFFACQMRDLLNARQASSEPHQKHRKANDA